jgi:hypothetical protein
MGVCGWQSRRHTPNLPHVLRRHTLNYMEMDDEYTCKF